MTCVTASADMDSLDEDAKHIPEARNKQQQMAVEAFVVFDCNWRAFEVFLYSATQWRFTPTGQPSALDYSSVQAVMNMLGVPEKKQARTFRGVRLIESGALKAFQEAANKASRSK